MKTASTNPFSTLFSGPEPKQQQIEWAVALLREMLEKPPNPRLAQIWAQILGNWTSDDLAAAFNHVAQTSTGWPTIGHLTEFILGQQWAKDLPWLLQALRMHGWEWKAYPAIYGPKWRKPGAKMDDWEDAPLLEDAIPAPEIPPVLARALEIFGGGRLEEGLKELNKHPSVRAIDWNAEEASRMKAQIEKGFHAAWLAARHAEMAH
jgi:hypothetical protein